MRVVTSRTLQIAAASALFASWAVMPALAAPQGQAPQSGQNDTTSEQTKPAPPASQGPLVLTPIESSWVIAPVAKLTKVAGVRSGLAGFYAGKQIENRVTLGGSAFWLANPTNGGTRMWYGGLAAGWNAVNAGPLSLRAQILLGGGQATRVVSAADLFFRPGPMFGGFSGPARVRLRDSFAVAEPELILQVRMADRVRLNLGAGYRGTTRAFGFLDDMRGPTASLGIEFKVGK